MRTQSGFEFAQPCERELNSHGQHDQPHETRDHVRLLRGTSHDQIIARSLMPLLVMMLSVTSVTVAHAKSRCVVADPTGTPLNVRTTPNGKIVSTLPNGQFVTIIDNSSDRSGKQWAYVSDYETSQPLGWVFRKFITCGATPLPTPPATSHQPAPTES